MDHPDQYAALRTEPDLMDTAIEECLRYAPPVIHFRRTAAVGTTLSGVDIAAGDKVVVFYPARTQLRHVLGRVARTFPTIRPAGTVDRLLSNFVAGIKHLPIALDG